MTNVVYEMAPIDDWTGWTTVPDMKAMRAQEQRAYDLQTANNYDELNAWIHRTGKAFIVGDDPELWCDLMDRYDLCPNGMFSCDSVEEARSDAMRNAHFGQLAHAFSGNQLIQTYPPRQREAAK